MYAFGVEGKDDNDYYKINAKGAIEDLKENMYGII